MAETLCQKRALEAFHLDPEKWGGKPVQWTTLFPVGNFNSTFNFSYDCEKSGNLLDFSHM